MKIKIVLGIMLLFLVAVFSSAQQSEELSVEAGTTPGNLFYGLDRAMESIQLAMTRDHIKKAELHLKHAEERLAEMSQLVEKNKLKHVEKLANDHQGSLSDAEEEVAEAEAQGQDAAQVRQRVAEATYKHILVLQRVMENAPEQAQQGLGRALNNSMKGYQSAVMKIESQTGKPADVPKPEKGELEQEMEQGEEPGPEQEMEQEAKGEGKLKMQITDKPGTINITKLEVTISSVKVHTSSSNFEGETCENETYVELECENETVIIGQTCVNVTEIVETCTNITEIVETCINITEEQEVCVNETFYNYTCAEDVCDEGVFVDDECTGTLIPGECINESYEMPVCANETIVTGQECVNETVITGQECVNETVITGESCENETEVQETCINVTKTRTVCTGIEGDGTAGWHTVVDDAKTFDLMKLIGVKDFLGETTLGAGNYQQIRLIVTDAKLWISGEEKALKIPSGSIKLVKPFTIRAGQTTTLTIDFDAEKSVHQAGPMYIMKPTIKVIAE